MATGVAMATMAITAKTTTATIRIRKDHTGIHRLGASAPGRFIESRNNRSKRASPAQVNDARAGTKIAPDADEVFAAADTIVKMKQP